MTQSELIHKVFYQDEFGAMLLKRWNESVLSNVPTDISSDKLVVRWEISLCIVSNLSF